MLQQPHPIIAYGSVICHFVANTFLGELNPNWSKVGVHVLSSPNMVCCLAFNCFLFSVLCALSSSVFVLLGQLLIFVWCRDLGNFGFYLTCLQVLHLHFHKKGKKPHHYCKEMVISPALIHLLKFNLNNTVWEKEVKIENVLVQLFSFSYGFVFVSCCCRFLCPL